MDIALQQDGDRCSIALGGSLDIYAAETLRTALHDALQRHRALELDMAAVEDLDSAGLQVLMAAKAAATAAGASLSMRAHSPAVLDVLALCRLQGYFGDPVVELGVPPRDPGAAHGRAEDAAHGRADTGTARRGVQ